MAFSSAPSHQPSIARAAAHGFRQSNHHLSTKEKHRTPAPSATNPPKLGKNTPVLPKWTQTDLSGISVDDSKFSVQPIPRYLIQKPQLTIP